MSFFRMSRAQNIKATEWKMSNKKSCKQTNWFLKTLQPLGGTCIEDKTKDGRRGNTFMFRGGRRGGPCASRFNFTDAYRKNLAFGNFLHLSLAVLIITCCLLSTRFLLDILSINSDRYRWVGLYFTARCCRITSHTDKSLHRVVNLPAPQCTPALGMSFYR